MLEEKTDIATEEQQVFYLGLHLPCIIFLYPYQQRQLAENDAALVEDSRLADELDKMLASLEERIKKVCPRVAFLFFSVFSNNLFFILFFCCLAHW